MDIGVPGMANICTGSVSVGEMSAPGWGGMLTSSTGGQCLSALDVAPHVALCV